LHSSILSNIPLGLSVLSAASVYPVMFWLKQFHSLFLLLLLLTLAESKWLHSSILS
ncbi:unnamed protein product, partial [Musa banksii]